MTPPDLIRAVRRRRGLTQGELAARAGTSQPVVSAYEHARRDPSFATLAKLIEAAGERLQIDAAPAHPELDPPRNLQEHNRRLLDVLSLAGRNPDASAQPRVAGAAHGLVLTKFTLAERVVALDGALASIPHAFGGTLALAYYAEPRATIDIDLNVFVGVDRYAEVAEFLVALGVGADDPTVQQHTQHDGQVRMFWDETPIDVFFAYDRFHDAAAAACRTVPFADTTIPILAPAHLVVCKVVYNRPKDWVDIDAMVATDAPIDGAEVARWVGRIAGDADPRYERIVALLTGS